MDGNMFVPNVTSRIRILQIHRPRNGTGSFGFYIRGGCEHGIGLFVSKVEEGSVACDSGLKVGDEILHINGFSIEEAIHEEACSIIARSKSLILRVQSVGMIPVRRLKSDPISWIPVNEKINVNCKTKHFVDYLDVCKYEEIKICIDISKTQKFGCSICKGPVEKPGIFVQSTTEGGLASEAGLEIGDQIISANETLFDTLSFQKIVEFLKACKHVELIVIKKAGLDLFWYNNLKKTYESDESHSRAQPVTNCEVSTLNPEANQAKANLSKTKTYEDLSVEPEKVSTNTNPIKLNGKEKRLEIVTDEVNATDGPKPESNITEQVPKVDLKHVGKQDQKLTKCDNNFEENREILQQNVFVGNEDAEMKQRVTAAEEKETKRKMAVWMKTPLADIHNSSQPIICHGKKDEETEYKKLPENREIHNSLIKDRLIEEFRQVHKKMFVQANGEIMRTNEEPTKFISKAEFRRKSVSFALDAQLINNAEPIEENEEKQLPNTVVNDEIVETENVALSDININATLSNENCTSTSSSKIAIKSADANKTSLAHSFKPKVTIGSYETSRLQKSKRIPNLPAKNGACVQVLGKVQIPKVNPIMNKFNHDQKAKYSSDEKHSSSPDLKINGVLNEAKPLRKTQLSLHACSVPVLNGSGPVLSSFNVAKAKFMIESKTVQKQKVVDIPKKINVNNTRHQIEEKQQNKQCIHNGHKISIKIPEEQIVIVRRVN